MAPPIPLEGASSLGEHWRASQRTVLAVMVKRTKTLYNIHIYAYLLTF